MRMFGEIALDPIARSRSELVYNGQVPVAGMRLLPDGTHVAILLPSRELDGPDQLWLYRVADRKLTPATPRPDMSAKHPADAVAATARAFRRRSEEHTSELQSLMRISYAVFCLKKKNHNTRNN